MPHVFSEQVQEPLFLKLSQGSVKGEVRLHAVNGKEEEMLHGSILQITAFGEVILAKKISPMVAKGLGILLDSNGSIVFVSR